MVEKILGNLIIAPQTHLLDEPSRSGLVMSIVAEAHKRLVLALLPTSLLNSLRKISFGDGTTKQVPLQQNAHVTAKYYNW